MPPRSRHALGALLVSTLVAGCSVGDPPLYAWVKPPFQDALAQRSGHGAVWLGAQNEVVIFGGLCGPSKSAATLCSGEAVTLNDGSWEVGNAGPAQREGPAVAAVGRPPQAQALLFGGTREGVPVLVPTWRWALDTWRPEESVPQPPVREGMALTSFQGGVLLFGGKVGEVYDADAWWWSPESGVWKSEAAPGPEGVVGHSLVTMDDGTVVLYGGRSGTGLAQRAWVNASGLWEALPEEQELREGHAAALHPQTGEMIVVGGRDESGESPSWLHSWDGAEWGWPDAVGTWPEPRTDATLVQYGDGLLLIGGYEDGGVIPEDIWLLEALEPDSYYGSSCGSTGGPSGALLLLLPLLVLAARRRAALLLAVLLPLSASAQDLRPQLVYLGFSAGAGLSEAEASAFSDHGQGALERLGAYRIVSMRDVEAILGLEASRQLLGCGEGAACMAELAGSLGADRALHGSVARLGRSVLVSLTLLDVASASRLAHRGERVAADEGSFEPALDVVPAMLAALVAADPGLPSPVREAALARPTVEEQPARIAKVGVPAPPSRPYVLLSGHLNTDVLGSVVLPGATVAWQPGRLGLAFTTVVRGAAIDEERERLPLLFRLDGRLMGAGDLLAPYAFGGVVTVLPDFGLRGGLGLLLRLGALGLSVEVGYEHFVLVSQPGAFRRQAVALTLGAGWRLPL